MKEPVNPGIQIEKLLQATLEGDWEDYVESMDMEGAPLRIQNELRRAFYAGAWVGLMDAILVTDPKLLDEVDARVYLHARCEQAVEHMKLVEAGLA